MKNFITPLGIFVCIMCSYYIEGNWFIGFVSVLYFYVLVLNSRRLVTLIPLIYFTSHLIFSLPFFIYNVPISFWSDFQTSDLLRKVFLIDSFFICSFSLSLSFFARPVQNDLNPLKGMYFSNTFLFVIISGIVLLLVYFGLGSSSILDGEVYGSQTKSSLNEYAIIFLSLLIFLRDKNSVLQLFLFVSLILFFILKNVLYGGRIEVLQLLLLLYYVYLVIPKRVGLKSFVLGSVSVFWLFSILGLVRNDPELLLDLSTLMDLSSELSFEIRDLAYLNSTQGDVIQSSARILGLVEKGYITLGDRIVGFPIFIFSGFIPKFLIPDTLNLSLYLQHIYQSGGGGLASVYFYTWLGYLGPILLGLWAGKSVSYLYNGSSKILLMYSLLVVITFPRWYSYNPIFFVKFCLYGALIYFLIRAFHFSIKRYVEKIVSNENFANKF